jgi:hypothetical protein
MGDMEPSGHALYNGDGSARYGDLAHGHRAISGATLLEGAVNVVAAILRNCERESSTTYDCCARSAWFG